MVGFLLAGKETPSYLHNHFLWKGIRSPLPDSVSVGVHFVDVVLLRSRCGVGTEFGIKEQKALSLLEGDVGLHGMGAREKGSLWSLIGTGKIGLIAEF